MPVTPTPWSSRVALELTKVAETLLSEGATAAHAEVAAMLLVRASTYAEAAKREISIMAPVEDDAPF